MKVAIVAPCHIRPTNDWIYSLEREARIAGATVIIVDDSNGNLGELPKDWRVYGYDGQQEVLGELYEDFARMFHKSSACRVFGHILAYREGFDVIIGLDSDCVVPFRFVQTHVATLNVNKAYGWTNPLGGSGWFTRGYPYSMRNWRSVANMGMWENVLDINGKDRSPKEPTQVNAPGSMVATAPLPFSGMNFSMLREAIPGFLFLPNFNFEDNKFHRIDDVWGGYIFQRLAKMRREAVLYGAPVVFHDTKVIASEDAAEEEAMYKYEDAFIDAINRSTRFYPFDEDTYISLFKKFYFDFTHDINTDAAVLVGLISSMEWWIKAFES